ncbi:MAG: hypothetical protein WC310_03850 [Patescibacteria group bacterium]|jgi:lipid-A-disaccharide synthase-like uncharacterized protein
MAVLFKICGVIGLVGIIIGVLVKNEKRQDWFFVFGGAFLLAYSGYLRDVIFIVLQIVFILVALAELVKLSRHRGIWKRVKDKVRS